MGIQDTVNQNYFCRPIFSAFYAENIILLSNP